MQTKTFFKLLTIAALCLAMAGCSAEDWDNKSWNDPVIPVGMIDIEAINIDNSGEFPVVSNSPIKKEAYMVGIKWITDNAPTESDSKFITGPIQKGTNLYSALGNKYSKAIKSNDRFNASVPEGKYISKFFKEIDRKYLPADINEGFVLLVAPDLGEHSFTVEYYEGSVLKFSYSTIPINFY